MSNIREIGKKSAIIYHILQSIWRIGSMKINYIEMILVLRKKLNIYQQQLGNILEFLLTLLIYGKRDIMSQFYLQNDGLKVV